MKKDNRQVVMVFMGGAKHVLLEKLQSEAKT